MRVYVASSWRNEHQPEVVEAVRAWGHEVYDFRTPPESSGFAWSEIDPAWEGWSFEQYQAALQHPRAREGCRADFSHMTWADACLLVMPCGRSAHLELGWSAGAGKKTCIYFPPGEMYEPELMVKMCDVVTNDPREVRAWLSGERHD